MDKFVFVKTPTSAPRVIHLDRLPANLLGRPFVAGETVVFDWKECSLDTLLNHFNNRFHYSNTLYLNLENYRDLFPYADYQAKTRFFDEHRKSVPQQWLVEHCPEELLDCEVLEMIFQWKSSASASVQQSMPRPAPWESTHSSTSYAVNRMKWIRFAAIIRQIM